MENNQFLTLTEFASRIGKSERQVRRYADQGRITLIDTPAGSRISTEDLEAWTRYETRLRGDASDIVAANAATMSQSAAAMSTNAAIAAADAAASKGQMPPYAATDSEFHGAESLPLRMALEHTSRLLEHVKTLQEQLEQARASELRAERQSAELRGHIGAHQRMLSESAQSLIESRAAAMIAEAQRQAAAAQLEELANAAAKELDHQPKIDTSRASRGWGSSIKRLLFRKIG